MTNEYYYNNNERLDLTEKEKWRDVNYVKNTLTHTTQSEGQPAFDV